MAKKPKYDPIKSKGGVLYKVKMEQGALDGRLSTKTVKDKTKYTRKTKHKE